MAFRNLLFLFGLLLMVRPDSASAQQSTAEVTAGYVGLIDEGGYLAVGGTVRRHWTSQLSVGPEFLVMNLETHSAASCVPTIAGVGGECPERAPGRAAMLTGSFVFDLLPPGTPVRTVTPFVVAGIGIMWLQDEPGDIRQRWSSAPVVTIGGGVRARLRGSVAVSAEYRLGGWNLHQRLLGALGVRW